MTYVLKNELLEIHIDHPEANYNFSRFDWTGKITHVKYRNIDLAGSEKMDRKDENHFGKGFYNEFGIDTPLGFNETEIGGWFHKIGIGLLKKNDQQYIFSKDYKLSPCEFTSKSGPNKVFITCTSPFENGYSYLLNKEIELFGSNFVIKSSLHNTGQKVIATDEYNHNFIAINRDLTGSNYTLNFPFHLRPKLFGETINPEGKVEIGQSDVKFNGTPSEPFFFSNLSGGNNVSASWELINSKCKIGIRETANFQTDKVNLWGCGHVISPEIFFRLLIKPGESTEWARTYSVFEVK